MSDDMLKEMLVDIKSDLKDIKKAQADHNVESALQAHMLQEQGSKLDAIERRVYPLEGDKLLRDKMRLRTLGGGGLVGLAALGLSLYKLLH